MVGLAFMRTDTGREPGEATAVVRPIELGQAGRGNNLCSASSSENTGLRGEYFLEADFRGSPALVRTDAVINFDADLDWPATLHAAQPQSARWRGWIKPPMNGAYRFHLGGGLGARVTISRLAVMGPELPDSVSFQMNAGRFYPITLEIAHLQTGAGPRISLEWTAPSGARYVVPPSLLRLPTESVRI